MLAQAFPGVAIPPEQDLAMLLAATGIAGDIDCKGGLKGKVQGNETLMVVWEATEMQTNVIHWSAVEPSSQSPVDWTKCQTPPYISTKRF